MSTRFSAKSRPGWLRTAKLFTVLGRLPFTAKGAPDTAGTKNFNENRATPYTSEDIRFTTKGSTLYAIALAWPADGKMRIRTLAAGSSHYPREIGRVEMLGVNGSLQFTRDAQGLVGKLPGEEAQRELVHAKDSMMNRP